VRVDGDRIVAVGDLPATPADTVIRGDGLALAPGFIDSHSHHDRGDYADRAMPVLLAQGVTTVVVGQDGAATALRRNRRPLRRAAAAVNVTAYTGHGYLRER
jgi:N-acyl-D-amino-acid deacylase